MTLQNSVSHNNSLTITLGNKQNKIHILQQSKLQIQNEILHFKLQINILNPKIDSKFITNVKIKLKKII